MSTTHDALGTISTKEKVESWIASTSEIPDPIEGQPGMLFQMAPLPVFIQDSHMLMTDSSSKERQRSLAISRQRGTSPYEASCDSIFKKYFPPHSSLGSKLVPGFQKAARRRQTISLLRKHAFRWATISSKKFVMIRTDGCNMVPWTDVSEYFFPSCDDPLCEIVLLALKYSMGYPKMTRHIHPCSQREQLKFGDLFKVVPYGTILVDIDAVLANKPLLWSMVEDMHASANAREKTPRCSYQCPEKFTETCSNVHVHSNVSRTTTPGLSQTSRTHNNTPCEKIMHSSGHTRQSPDFLDTKPKQDNDISFHSHGSNMVEFLGTQATQMWNTLSEGKSSPIRPSKSLSDATPPKHGQSHPDSSNSDHSFRNAAAPDNQQHHGASLLHQGDGTKGVLMTQEHIPPTSADPTPTTVVGLRINNHRFLPVVISADNVANANQELGRWMVPVYLAQNLCLNTHVVGKLVGVYRDFIVGRTTKTAGLRGFVRLCSRQEGRDLTRWLYYMSEKVGLIPNWTIVTSRCLLIQWRDFLQFLPNDLVQVFEIDLSLTFQLRAQANAKTIMPSTSQDCKSLPAPCNSVKTSVQPCQTHRQSHTHSQKKLECQEQPSKPPGVGLVADWNAPLWEDSELPFTDIKEEVVPPWAMNAFDDNLGDGNLTNAEKTVDSGAKDLNSTKGNGNKTKALAARNTAFPSIATGEQASSKDKDNIQTEIIKQDSCNVLKEKVSVKRLVPSPRNQKYSLRKSLKERSLKETALQDQSNGDLGATLGNQQLDTFVNGITPGVGRSQLSKNGSAQNVRGQESDLGPGCVREAESLAKKMDLPSEKGSPDKMPKDLIDCSSYDKYANKRKQAGNNIRLRSSTKTASSKTDTPDPKSPQQTNTTVAQTSKGSESQQPQTKSLEKENDIGIRKNRFEGLTLWSAEDEMSTLDASLKSSNKTTTVQKMTTDVNRSTGNEKTVSWFIPGVYPIEKPTKPQKSKGMPVKSRKQKIDKTKGNTGESESLQKDDTSGRGGGESQNLYMEGCNDAMKDKTVTNVSGKTIADVEAKPSSLVNNVSRDTIVEPGGKFRGYVPRYYEQKIPKSATHIVSLHMEPLGCEPQSSHEDPVKPPEDEQTIAKRFTLGRQSHSQDTHTPSEQVNLSIKNAKSDLQVGKTVETERAKSTRIAGSTPRTSKRKRDTNPVRAAPEVKSMATDGKINTCPAEKSIPSLCSQKNPADDPDLRVKVDRTKVTNSSAVVEHQKTLLEAIQKKTKHKPVEVNKDPPKKGILKRWTQNKEKIHQEIYGPKLEFNFERMRRRSLDGSIMKTCEDKGAEKGVARDSYPISPNTRSQTYIENVSSRSPEKELYIFQPHLDARQSVSNRGLVLYKDLNIPYVAMNGFKYVTLKDASQVFPHCRPNCGVAKSFLRCHRSLHRTMCSWDQVYDFELTQPGRKPPVRTGDVLLRFDTLMTRLPQLEREIQDRHKGVPAKRSKGCNYGL